MTALEKFEDLISTEDLAKKFGISKKYIQNLKGEKENFFIEGLHYVKFKGQVTLFSKKAILDKLGLEYEDKN